MNAVARSSSGVPIGIDAILVEVEVDLSAQLPAISTVGLAKAEVRESKDRVKAAIRNAGFKFPPRKVTVNLAPADVPKSGTAFDLPIATAVLAAAGELRIDSLTAWVQLGELALDGTLRPVSGVLPVARAALRLGRRGILVAEANAAEAAMVPGLEVRSARTLGEVVSFLNAKCDLPEPDRTPGEEAPSWGPDLAFVRGHTIAKRAMEIAAAGGHNVLLVGPPGSGKTLLARCLPSILPPLARDEALEVTAIHSVAGMLPSSGVIRTRPFRAPHASVRPQALVGGGQPFLPGEVTLAHRGVLFLDEFPEINRDSLEALRAPMEDRAVTIARAGRRISLPASFMLVAAMNPCPCGRSGSALRCTCSEDQIRRYVSRISGPLVDRIDVGVRVEALIAEDYELPAAEPSEKVRERVMEARARARARIETSAHARRFAAACNAELPREDVERHAGIDAHSKELLAERVDAGLSGRARERALRVARTIADLAGEERVRVEHVEEALAYREALELSGGAR